MSTLEAFSQKERNDHAYQARKNYLREQLTIQQQMEEAEQARKAAEQALEQERQQKLAAPEGIERLKALLEWKARGG